MLTRRTGEAWDAAQKFAEARHPTPPVTLIVRFDIERQKLSSAMHPDAGRHRL
jgi:hypothetical protein